MSQRENLYELARQLGIAEPERLQGQELARAITLARAIVDLYEKAEWLDIQLPKGLKSIGRIQALIHDEIQKRLQHIKICSTFQLKGVTVTVTNITMQRGVGVYWLKASNGTRAAPVKEHSLLHELQKEGRV